MLGASKTLGRAAGRLLESIPGLETLSRRVGLGGLVDIFISTSQPDQFSWAALGLLQAGCPASRGTAPRHKAWACSRVGAWGACLPQGPRLNRRRPGPAPGWVLGGRSRVGAWGACLPQGPRQNRRRPGPAPRWVPWVPTGCRGRTGHGLLQGGRIPGPIHFASIQFGLWALNIVRLVCLSWLNNLFQTRNDRCSTGQPNFLVSVCGRGQTPRTLV